MVAGSNPVSVATTIITATGNNQPDSGFLLSEVVKQQVVIESTNGESGTKSTLPGAGQADTGIANLLTHPLHEL